MVDEGIHEWWLREIAELPSGDLERPWDGGRGGGAYHLPEAKGFSLVWVQSQGKFQKYPPCSQTVWLTVLTSGFRWQENQFHPHPEEKHMMPLVVTVKANQNNVHTYMSMELNISCNSKLRESKMQHWSKLLLLLHKKGKGMAQWWAHWCHISL